MVQVLAKGFWQFIPLNVRKQLIIWVDLQKWLPNCHSLSIMIVRDWAEKDVNSYHRFLWFHHLAYAKYYEKVNDFNGNLTLVRRIFFEDLKNFLSWFEKSSSYRIDVKNIFEVGCSSGYLLRFMETNLFKEAVIIEGLDIDALAVEKGKAYLSEHKSKIKLTVADMIDLDRVMNGHKYDLIVCAGVLMYLQENNAAAVVKSMLAHCNGIVAIAGLAHPNIDNYKLAGSESRRSDGALIHNIEAMVENTGGQIEYRRWEGSKTFDKQTIYFVFCRPHQT